MNESFRVEKLKAENETLQKELEIRNCIAKENEELRMMVQKLTSEKEMLKECIVKLTMEKLGVF